MNISIHNNLLMMNANNQYKLNLGKENKAVEKLSSGYRINRAADDAANLQISEKMRAQIRGLHRGSDNAADGISWVQTGDGALNEVQAMLHRMKELTVKSLNDTNTAQDRAAIQAEFDALQSEIDHIFDSTEFNKNKVFEAHQPTYHQYEGNVVWDQSQPHVITGGANDLVVGCVKSVPGSTELLTVTVPPGVYTTQELMDELDDAMERAGAKEKGLVMEYTQNGTCNLNYEGGEKIDFVGGELAYLLYDVYQGGSMGALIGTTSFSNQYAEIAISSQNNQLSFDIESLGGGVQTINMVIPDGSYNKQQIINILNQKLAGTDVQAKEYGTGIMLSGNDSIVTRFKGNMFKIDEGLPKYTSVFYDNVKHGNITMGAASFLGGYVIPKDSRDEEHKRYEMRADNNQLMLQPNGSDAPVTITIPEGKYTVNEMVTKLNQLFTANGLELSATVRSSGTFQGIRIDSTVKGVTSKVGIDSANSSAFNTLFVNRTYNAYVSDAVYSKETKADNPATFNGAKSFTADNLPFEINSTNNTFQLSLTNESGNGTYTITLADGNYNSAADIANAINDQLSSPLAPMGYRGLVEAKVENNKIVLQGGPGVSSVTTSANSPSTGYEDIFVRKYVEYQKQEISGSTVTTNTPISDKTNIAAGDNQFDVQINGSNHTVTLPTGSDVSRDDIKNAIESSVPEQTIVTPNRFSTLNAVGSSSDMNFSGTKKGSTTPQSANFDATGSSQGVEGEVGVFVKNNPAKITITPALEDTTVITGENNQLQIQILKDEFPKSISIPEGSYTRAALASAIQSRINEAFGEYWGGATVSVSSSGELEIEARVVALNPDNSTSIKDASLTKISCNTEESSFLKDLNTIRKPAVFTSTPNLKNSITISDSNNALAFSYAEGGVTKTASITLSSGTYTPDTIVNEINNKLQGAGVGVTASSTGNKLVLTTNAKGSDTSITFNSKTAGSAVEALFGDLTSERTASGRINKVTQDPIEIDSTSNTFNMTVNGAVCNLVLDSGVYSRDGFVSMLNQKIADAGVGVNVTQAAGKLYFETVKKGSGASINISYDSGGTSMKAIYGETTTVIPGLKADFTPDGKLTLSTTTGSGTIKMNSDSGGMFQEPLVINKTENPTSKAGYYSTKKCSIDGVNISEPIAIDEWNNDLKFDYVADGISKSISVSVPEKSDYTFAELQAALQAFFDANPGAGELKVTVNGSGVRIETVKTGSKYYMESFKGDFYDKVLCSTKERTVSQSVNNVNGSQSNDLAFTVGRRDVRNNPVELKKGFSDTLSIDFTYNGTTRNLNMNLTPGKYSGDELVDEIQEQLNKALVAAGFEKNVIEVGIGGVSTGVAGSNDSNALVFKLSSTVKLPGEGQYIIDGVGGNAAFSVFYQTDGKMEPAYVKGSKDITDGVTIEPGREDFSFEVDGTEYSLNIPEGEYTRESILNTVNSLLTGAGAPVSAEEEDGHLVLRHDKMGNHKIGNLKGEAKQALFFRDNGAVGDAQGLMLQLSGKLPDYTMIERQTVNTAFLGINSIAVTAPKYAEKALGRLDEALNKVSDIRSSFGSKQNQLERTINSNANEAENTQRAESLLRDADMAEEMVRYSTANILKQAAQSMMAQAGSMSEGVLKLLT